ncbi:hypothetical protein J5N97_023010 [Dioscorea zingiberensis]|uniref:Uncharacterized protein n=1 Tax=Dioscorea zingiberensis TaxID=325984 RepID=A0A9D5CC80_9LILI|nr:hypothetical protein J5N97_023010 [Dioscorea zingiberensis]
MTSLGNGGKSNDKGKNKFSVLAETEEQGVDQNSTNHLSIVEAVTEVLTASDDMEEIEDATLAEEFALRFHGNISTSNSQQQQASIAPIHGLGSLQQQRDGMAAAQIITAPGWLRVCRDFSDRWRVGAAGQSDVKAGGELHRRSSAVLLSFRDTATSGSGLRRQRGPAAARPCLRWQPSSWF